MDMMRRCMDWMMSLGWLGMALGVALLVALVVLVALLIRRVGSGPRP
jgi:hypothetical protein